MRTPDAARLLPSLDRGERLCDAFEAFRTCFPQSPIEFEQLVLLALTLAQGDALELDHCKNCEGVILVDRLAVSRHLCSYCHQGGGQDVLPAPTVEVESEAGDRPEDRDGQQQSLF